MCKISFNPTPFDNAFHTMVQRAPELLIPLVNEVFQEDFSEDDEVVVQSNDLPSVDDRDEIQRRFSDSVFSIRGAETRLFHIECESRSDGNIEIRMVEYNFHKALRDARYEGGELVVEIPSSAIIFLRHTRNTPDRYWVRIVTPGEEARYPIEVLKIGRYTLEELFRKDLLFLLPFHIFVYEDDLPRINEDPELLKSLMRVYEEILQEVGIRSAQGALSANTEKLLHSMMRHVLEGVARNYDQVREVGNTMLGRVIDDDFTRLLDKIDEKEKQLSELDDKLFKLDEKLVELDNQLAEKNDQLAEKDDQLAEARANVIEAETKMARIQRAAEYLTVQGRPEEIIRLYQETEFLENILKEAE